MQKQKWTIWEFIDYHEAKQKWAQQNYEKLCRKVAWFDNILSFHQVWNRIPHSQVKEILCDGEKFKVFKDFEDIPYQAATIMIFKHGIQPMFEDKRNKAELRLELGNIREPEQLQLIWETFVFDVISGNCPGITDNEDEGISGIRLHQKSQGATLKGYRLEVWLLSNDEENKHTKEVLAYLDDHIRNDICGTRLADARV